MWLDLDPVVYPCPQGGKRFREFVQETGGKAQFPYLIDENTGVKMYESDDIIEYLYENYGPGKDKVRVDFSVAGCDRGCGSRHARQDGQRE